MGLVVVLAGCQTAPPLDENPEAGQPFGADTAPFDPNADPFAGRPFNDPFGQPLPSDPFGQPLPRDPFGQPQTGDPFGQPLTSDPFGVASIDATATPSTTGAGPFGGMGSQENIIYFDCK